MEDIKEVMEVLRRVVVTLERLLKGEDTVEVPLKVVTEEDKLKGVTAGVNRKVVTAHLEDNLKVDTEGLLEALKLRLKSNSGLTLWIKTDQGRYMPKSCKRR